MLSCVEVAGKFRIPHCLAHPVQPQWVGAQIQGWINNNWFKHILFHLHEKGLCRAQMLCWSPLPQANNNNCKLHWSPPCQMKGKLWRTHLVMDIWTVNKYLYLCFRYEYSYEREREFSLQGQRENLYHVEFASQSVVLAAKACRKYYFTWVTVVFLFICFYLSHWYWLVKSKCLWWNMNYN